MIGALRARVSVWPGCAAYAVLVPPTLGEHAEQNVSLATSLDARPRRFPRPWFDGIGCYGVLRSVPSFLVRRHGSAPREPY